MRCPCSLPCVCFCPDQVRWACDKGGIMSRRSVLEALPHTALSSGRTHPQRCAGGRGPSAESTRLIRLRVRDVVNGKDRPLARPPSLRGLRRRLRADFVRPPRRYDEVVRLPRNVHVGRAACGLLRPSLGSRPRESPGSPGSRAWSFHACTGSSTPRLPEATRGYAAPDIAFPLTSQGRHAGVVISELNGWPACAPVERFTRDLTAAGA